MKNKTPMYQCKSIWNGETNQVENCTCGRCAELLSKKYLIDKENIKEILIHLLNIMTLYGHFISEKEYEYLYKKIRVL